MMQISVVIPTCKPQSYIWKCLDSLESQTMNKKEFEVVIVLNGCDEPYHSQIAEYISEHPQLQIRFLHTPVSGVSHARNTGIKSAIGKYICFIDDDDYVSDDYLQLLFNEASYGCIPLGNFLNFYDEKPDVFFDDYISKGYKKICGKKNLSIWDVKVYMNVLVCKLIPRDICLKEEFNTLFSRGEDSLYMFSISRFFHTYKAASADAVYYRRIRSASATHTERFPQMIKRGFLFSWKILRIWLKHPSQYNFFFFISRCLAIWKAAVCKILEM